MLPQLDDDNDSSTNSISQDKASTEQNGEIMRKARSLSTMQTDRGFSRKIRGFGDVVYAEQIEKCDESKIKLLTPKVGRVKVHKEVTDIRYILDQFKQHRNKLKIELEHSFDYKRAAWEFFYNYFAVLMWPVMILREGVPGFWARQPTYHKPMIAWTGYMVANVAYIWADPQIRNLFFYPFCIMQMTNIARVSILAMKYGYYPTDVFAEYSEEDPPITIDYINSLHLVPGWTLQHPMTMARELFLTEQRLQIDLQKLKLNFRDTRAFDMKKMKNCSCSRYETTLDWFIPYIMTHVKSGGEGMFNHMWTILYMVTVLLLYVTISRLMPHSISDWNFTDCTSTCWILTLSIPFPLGWGAWATFLWSVAMAIDFNRRYYRMSLCTHLLDPKRETFLTNEMRRSYKAQLFGTSSGFKMKKLQGLDLQTIDVYSADTVFAWCQFRYILFDAGKMFLNREEAYTGVILTVTMGAWVIFLYCLVHDEIILVWEDAIITLILSIFTLIPSMWTLSCATSLNYQTEKQQKLLSERSVEMLYQQFNAQEQNQQKWADHIQKARECVDSAVDVLSIDEYNVQLFGMNVDTAVTNLISTVIGILLYVSGYLVYQEWIVK